MSHREPVAADVLKTGRPLGLTDDTAFAGFKKILRVAFGQQCRYRKYPIPNFDSSPVLQIREWRPPGSESNISQL
jgi:hypothetical protein